MSRPGEPKVAMQPLLPPGRHLMTLNELKTLCVDRFPSSTTRSVLFPQLELLVSDLRDNNVICELQLDGSFLTEKPEPDDIDLSFSAWVEDFERLDVILQNALMSKLNGGHAYSAGLDTYICFRFHRNDPRKAADKTDYWAEKWGIGWDEKLKGYAILKRGETDVGLRLFT